MSVSFSSHLGPAMSDFVALKQALGRRFAGEIRILADFDRFFATRCTAACTSDIFASWCLTLARLSPATRRAHMRVVRNFCLYLRRRDPGCFVPNPDAFPPRQPPARPHIFSEGDIAHLLDSTKDLQPRSTSPLHGPIYRLALVLLYTAGLRRGELARLVLSDHDPVEGTLLIRASKFHKSRLVALSQDAARELDAYLVERRLLPHDADAPLLTSSFRGLRAYSGAGLGAGLHRLFRDAGLRTASGRIPRVHDLRHTHAVHALLRWYRAGLDVQTKLPFLSMSMGHVSIASTAYYLTFLDPVAEAASDRFATHCAQFLGQLDGGAR